jgi:predicted permease
MQVLRQDLAYAVRQLRRTPGFTLLVLLTIALGIGANTAVFSLINGYLRPLPVRSPEQIVVLAAQTKGDDVGLRYRFPFAVVQDLRAQAGCFSDVLAFGLGLSGINADGRTTEFFYSIVTGNFFPALGLSPAAGRLFVAGEGEHPGGDPLLVLGHGYWQKRFGGAPDVIGRSVRVDGKLVRIVGVAPKEFHGPYGGAEMEGYMLLDWSAASPYWDSPTELYTSRTARRWTVIARLKPAVTLKQAQSSLDVLMRRLEAQHPASDRGIGVRVVPEPLSRPEPVRVLSDAVPLVRRFVPLLGGLVLLLACMNVANLMLVRATGRQREMAIRAALGSGRGRLVRQMLTESALLGFAGAVLGVVFGKWGKDAFAASIDLATDFPTFSTFASTGGSSPTP